MATDTPSLGAKALGGMNLEEASVPNAGEHAKETPKSVGESQQQAPSAPKPSSSNEHRSEMSSGGPTGVRFALLFTCILVANFLIGYDTSCIATLTPVITDQFHALQDLGCLLAQSATMMIFGQVYSFYSMKTLFIASMTVFTAASVLCASAPTSTAFIVGRGLSGLGAAGAVAGTFIILANTTSLKSRLVFLAVAGGVESSALAFGPVISGAISHTSSWRVSFYVIIPFAALCAFTVLVSVGQIRKPENADLSIWQGLQRIDWLGFGISVPMTICLVMGLEWAGATYAWNDWRIILLLTLAGLLLTCFLGIEIRGKEKSLVPLNMLGQRSVAFASIVTFCNYAHLSLVAYYLPFYFQAVRGASTVGSGVMYLPTAGALALGALASGPLTRYIGFYNAPLTAGSCIMVVGMGLMTTFAPHTDPAKWISFQIVYGIGIGLAFQPPFIAVQTVLEDSLVPKALVLLSYIQQSGGIVMLSAAQNVFLSRLSRNLAQQVPGLDARAVLSSGALNLVQNVPASLRKQVLIAYNEALMQVLYTALGLTCVAAVAALGLEWKSVKKERKT